MQATEIPVLRPEPKLSATRIVTPKEYRRLRDAMSDAIVAYDLARDTAKAGEDFCGLCVLKLEAEMHLAMQSYNEAVRPKGLYDKLLLLG